MMGFGCFRAIGSPADDSEVCRSGRCGSASTSQRMRVGIRGVSGLLRVVEVISSLNDVLRFGDQLQIRRHVSGANVVELVEGHTSVRTRSPAPRLLPAQVPVLPRKVLVDTGASVANRALLGLRAAVVVE